MIRVSDCKACHCEWLGRLRQGQYNTGPFFCRKDKNKETIRLLYKCPLNKVQDY